MTNKHSKESDELDRLERQMYEDEAESERAKAKSMESKLAFLEAREAYDRSVESKNEN